MFFLENIVLTCWRYEFYFRSLHIDFKSLKTKYMDTLIILLVGYVILKSIFSGGDDNDKKPKRRKRSKKSSFGNDTPTYSDYDTWNRSHGDKNRL